MARACATDFKPAQLELGGNNALIVLDDADLDRAADGVVAGLTTLNGQWCRALGRLLLHETIADKLLDRVVERLRRLRIGNALDEESEMGPLIHSDHRDAINTTLSGYTKKVVKSYRCRHCRNRLDVICTGIGRRRRFGRNTRRNLWPRRCRTHLCH